MLSIFLLIALAAVLLLLAAAPRLWPGFTWFRRTNVPTSWNLAGYHDPRSLTWSWFVGLSLFRADEHRFWPLAWVSPYGASGRLVLRIPFVGFLRLHTQTKMLRHATARGLRLAA